MDFDGYAVGGLAVGEGQELMAKITDYCTSNLPFEKPRYLMGVGYPSDILEAVKKGLICLIAFYQLDQVEQV